MMSTEIGKSPEMEEDHLLAEEYTPTAKDVLCGRGGAVTHHEGNIGFREMITKNSSEYHDGNKPAKSELIQTIAGQFRFLKADRKSGRLFLLDSASAKEKVGQAFRDIKTKWNTSSASRAKKRSKRENVDDGSDDSSDPDQADSVTSTVQTKKPRVGEPSSKLGITHPPMMNNTLTGTMGIAGAQNALSPQLSAITGVPQGVPALGAGALSSFPILPQPIVAAMPASTTMLGGAALPSSAAPLIGADQQLVLLPLGYSPGPQDVVCDAGPAAATLPGNQQFEALIGCYLIQFQNTPTERGRHAIIVKVLSQIGQRGGRFIAQHRDALAAMRSVSIPRWMELSADLVFEKIQSAFLVNLKSYQIPGHVGLVGLGAHPLAALPATTQLHGNLPRKVTNEGQAAHLANYSQAALPGQAKVQNLPTENDVLYGAGTEVLANPGNIRFRQLLEVALSRLQQNKAANSKQQEAVLAVEITKGVWQRGGRFLQRSGGAGTWTEMPNNMAIDLTQKALSEQRLKVAPSQKEQDEVSSVASEPPPPPPLPPKRKRSKQGKKRKSVAAVDGDRIQIFVPPRTSGTNEDSPMKIMEVDVRRSSLKQNDKAKNRIASPRTLVKESEVSAQDVLFGMGKTLANHQGNGFFHELIRKLASSFLDAQDQAAKDKVVRKVMKKIHKSGGRFFERVSEEELLGGLCWWALSDEAARGMIQTAFTCRVYRAEESEWSEKFQECQVKAQQGDSLEQYQLGCCYKLGQMVNQDLIIANHWFRCAARQGHADAKLEWTNKLEKGQVDSKHEYELAVAVYMRKSAEEGKETAAIG